MTTFTVTATQGGQQSNGMVLRIKVLTGAALAATPATASQSAGSAAAHNASITTTVVGSYVYGALISDSSATAFTAEPNTTLFDNLQDTTNAEYYGTGRTTAATTAGTLGATTVGASAPSTAGGCAFLEVIPNGTITEDASSPAVASTTTATTVTSASFTPPPGSLLVAMVSSDGGAGVCTMTVSGGGLTWTQRVAANASTASYAGVWTAQIPVLTSPQAIPGQTWRRYFKHRQQPVSYAIAAVTPPVVTPAPLYPLIEPVKAKLPFFPPGIAGFAVTGGGLPVNQSSGTGSGYGRVFSNTGIFYGSVIYPPAGPVTARYPQPQLHGRVVRNAGAFSGTGTAVKSLQGPVTARRPQPQLSGRALGVQHAGTFTPATGPALTPLKGPVKARSQAPVLHGHSEVRTGTFSGSGPAPKPLVRPVTARLPAPRTRGYATSRAGVFTPPAPPVTSTGSLQQPAGIRFVAVRTGHVQSLPGAAPFFAQIYPLQGPVTIRRTQPPRGRIYGIVKAGPSTGQGPARVYPLRKAITAAARPLPLRGHGGTASGRFAGTGPAPVVLRQPVQSRPARPASPVLHGRAMAIYAILAPGSGAPVPPLPGPVAVTVYPVRVGWVLPGTGLAAGVGPALKPLNGPAAAKLPPFPFRKGRVQGNPGTFSGTGSAVTPLHRPAAARPAFPVLHGRARGSAGTFTFIAPGNGPQLYPLHGPVTARQPLPVVHGRAMAIYSLLAGVTAIPAPVYPLQGPIGIGRRAPGPARYGRITSTPGTFSGHGPALTPLTAPVRIRVPVPPFSKGRGSGSQGAAIVIVPAPLYPLQRPVRAPLPGPFLHGRAISRKGAFSGTGPPVRPLTSPVSIHHPLPPQGRVIKRAGTFTATGSPVPPKTGPVTARRPQPTRYGRGNGSPGRSSGTGPPARPLSNPVRSRPPLGPRGHGGRNAGAFSGTGVSPKPLTTPVRARQPLPPRGIAQWRIGGPFVPPPPVMAPPATLYLTQATITQAPPYAATTVTGTGSLLTISPDSDTAVTISPATEGIAPVQVTPPPDALLPSPDDVTLFPDLPG